MRQINTISILSLLYEGKLDTGHGHLYEDSCFIVSNLSSDEIRFGEPLFKHPTRLDSFTIMICQQGSVTLECDMQQLTLGPQSILIIRPEAIVRLSASESCRISILMGNESFLERLNISAQKLFPHVNELVQFSCFPIEDKFFTTLNCLFTATEECIAQDPILPYYHETVRAAVRAFGYLILSLILHQIKGSVNSAKPIHNRKEESFRRFIRLVSVHYKQERKILFYASQMNLTPKYLSTLIHEISGRSPSEWIDDYVTVEAKNLLRYSSMSIQQVAYELNFPNQSFFGRWFKAHTGESPKAYRNKQ